LRSLPAMLASQRGDSGSPATHPPDGKSPPMTGTSNMIAILHSGHRLSRKQSPEFPRAVLQNMDGLADGERTALIAFGVISEMYESTATISAPTLSLQ